MRIAKLGTGVRRGVWLAEWKGQNDEMILVAVDSNRRRVAERVVAIGGNHLDAAEELLDLLDEQDPALRSMLKII